MLFNSFDFALFLPIVFILYWFVFNKSVKQQNIFIVIASYFFYGCWDLRFLVLIFLSSLVDFVVGVKLGKTKQKKSRKILLCTSLFFNLGLLGAFKYANFFIDSFEQTFRFFGSEFSGATFYIILPVGISFYTLQTLSYTIDVYRNKIKPTNDIVSFFAFVSFFPQLVAGPIEKACNLLPQFYIKRIFNSDFAIDGLRQVLWGLFKKILVADNCARYVNDIFAYHENYSSGMLITGVFLFSFQIYGDFSGYSDIAIGTSKLFSFKLQRNFAFPYFSRDIAEFWRRWHISLSSWFKEYLYIPMGGSKGPLSKVILNVFIVFIVSGFWHGANWTYIIWGGLNAIYFIPLLLLKNNRKNIDNLNDSFFLSFRATSQILFTFLLVSFSWIFFRANSLVHAISYLSSIATNSHSTKELPSNKMYFLITIAFISTLVIVEWIQKNKDHGLSFDKDSNFIVRWGTYYMLTAAILLFRPAQQNFIYFQF